MRRWSAFAAVAVLLLVLPAGAWLLRSHRRCQEYIPMRITNAGDVELVDVSIGHVGNDHHVTNIGALQTGYVWLPLPRFEGETWGKTATLNFRYASGGAVSTGIDLSETPSRVWITIGPKGPLPSISVSRTPWWLPPVR